MKVAGPATDDALIDALDESTARMAAASAETLVSVAETDRRRLWRRDGATSMSSWLAARYGLAWGTAREWVRVAHAFGVFGGSRRRIDRVSCPGTSFGR
jgi:hypothetical protein